ncbi:MAG: hypothetical protein LBH58_08700 [Tannerellaceae bacterium]|jgi:hypothetical protein|nr:hypothetical protein [Tannerellaceae bacterium]
MGFFNFKKKRTSSTIQEKLKIETPANIESPTIQPEQKEKTKPHVPTPPKRKKEKKDVADFFTVNIYEIFKHEPISVGNGTGTNGQPVEIFSFKLPDLELNTFYKVNILKYADNHYDLVFISNINDIRNELKEFVDFCMKTFGNDFMNKGSVNKDDFRDATLGVFSRVWYGNACLENPNFAITLTLFDV